MLPPPTKAAPWAGTRKPCRYVTLKIPEKLPKHTPLKKNPKNKHNPLT